MNFRVILEPDGWTRVTTETRIHAVDRATQRRFARYWRVIYPGSWLIRWSWLRAIEAAVRTEPPSHSTTPPTEKGPTE